MSYANLQILSGETQMDVVRRINVSALIQEVKKHPILYNNTPKQIHSTEMRKRIWEMIAEKLCGSEQYQQYDETERETVGKEIQFKWKNLKDNFHRILRKQKEDELNGVPPYKKKKYIYYDALEFLRPYAPRFRRSDLKDEMEIEGGKNSSNIIYINETNDSEEDTVSQSTPQTVPKPINVQPPPIAPIPSFGTLQPVQFIHLHPNSSIPTPAKEEVDDSAVSKMSQLLEQMVKSQSEEKNDDPMGNKKFLLSLEPFLKKLPDDVNLEVRLQIMGVIQSYGLKELF